MKEKVHTAKFGTREVLFGRILDEVDRVRGSKRKVRRATQSIDGREARCVESEGGICVNKIQAQISVN